MIDYIFGNGRINRVKSFLSLDAFIIAVKAKVAENNLSYNAPRLVYYRNGTNVKFATDYIMVKSLSKTDILPLLSLTEVSKNVVSFPKADDDTCNNLREYLSKTKATGITTEGGSQFLKHCENITAWVCWEFKPNALSRLTINYYRYSTTLKSLLLLYTYLTGSEYRALAKSLSFCSSLKEFGYGKERAGCVRSSSPALLFNLSIKESLGVFWTPWLKGDYYLKMSESFTSLGVDRFEEPPISRQVIAWAERNMPLFLKAGNLKRYKSYLSSLE